MLAYNLHSVDLSNIYIFVLLVFNGDSILKSQDYFTDNAVTWPLIYLVKHKCTKVHIYREE